MTKPRRNGSKARQKKTDYSILPKLTKPRKMEKDVFGCQHVFARNLEKPHSQAEDLSRIDIPVFNNGLKLHNCMDLHLLEESLKGPITKQDKKVSLNFQKPTNLQNLRNLLSGRFMMSINFKSAIKLQ